MAEGIAFTPEAVEEAKQKIITFIAEGFNATLTAAILHARVGKSVVYEWMDADPAFKAAIAKARDRSLENGLDLAENKLLTKVQEGDSKSIRYFLDRRGGGRGYNPKVTNELTGPNGAPLEPPRFTLDFTGNLDEPTPPVGHAASDKA